MKHLSLSGSVAAVVAVVVLFLVATDRVSAANVATFSSLVATGTVSLADTSYQQVWSPNPPPSPCWLWAAWHCSAGGNRGSVLR